MTDELAVELDFTPRRLKPEPAPEPIPAPPPTIPLSLFAQERGLRPGTVAGMKIYLHGSAAPRSREAWARIVASYQSAPVGTKHKE